jgi:hypothetical protein
MLPNEILLAGAIPIRLTRLNVFVFGDGDMGVVGIICAEGDKPSGLNGADAGEGGVNFDGNARPPRGGRTGESGTFCAEDTGS